MMQWNDSALEVEDISVYDAAKKMLNEKYQQLEDLFEEIEIYQFIVDHPDVAHEMESIMRDCDV